ncbi:MAG: hypothetical protein MI976_24085 [Pseudomonadales bacterium]|nr:hypothetical protein [Pseudomonadales bacterium]
MDKAVSTPVIAQHQSTPSRALPWYPLLAAPVRMAIHTYYGLRGTKELNKFAQRCRKAQLRELDAYFGDRNKDIIKPESDHAAYVRQT